MYAAFIIKLIPNETFNTIHPPYYSTTSQTRSNKSSYNCDLIITYDFIFNYVPFRTYGRVFNLCRLMAHTKILEEVILELLFSPLAFLHTVK